MLTKPMEHQRAVHEHVLGRRCSFNFGQQGTGKTWNALALAEELWRRDPNLRPLVVCLKGNMRGVWAAEAEKHAGMDAVVVEGTPSKRVKLLGETSRLRIINYHGLKIERVIAALESDAMSPGLVIYDESFTLQTPKRFTSKRKPTLFGAAYRLREVCGRVHGMTGTPHGNNPLSLWAQCYAVDGGLTFGTNFYAWRAKNFEDVGTNWQDWWPNRGYRRAMNDRLYRMPGLAVRFLKSDCADLPPKTYQTVRVDMPRGTLERYRGMEKDFYVETDRGVCETQSAGVQSLRLRELCNGFLRGIGQNGGPNTEIIWEADSNPKQAALEMVLRDLCADGGKVIVWHAFRPDQADIVHVCREMGLKGVRLCGGMSADEVHHASTRFNESPDMQVAVASLAFKGATHGANLQAAHGSVYYSNTWSLPDRLQSEDRCHRIGSDIHDSITYVDIVCDGTVEENVAEALQRKADSAEIVVDGHRLAINLGSDF